MTEEQEFETMIDELFDEYMVDGFDFSSDMTFDEVFKKIFTDAVLITLDKLDSEEEDE